MVIWEIGEKNSRNLSNHRYTRFSREREAGIMGELVLRRTMECETSLRRCGGQNCGFWLSGQGTTSISFTNDNNLIPCANEMGISPFSAMETGRIQRGRPSSCLTIVNWPSIPDMTSIPAMHLPPRLYELAKQMKYLSIIFRWDEQLRLFLCCAFAGILR